jgi:hypothetical protein
MRVARGVKPERFKRGQVAQPVAVDKPAHGGGNLRTLPQFGLVGLYAGAHEGGVMQEGRAHY